MRGTAYIYPDAPQPAVRSVDLEVRAGEWVALVGANGSGKSTLARICNALLLPTQGDCFVLGRDVREPQNLRYVREKVALVFQNPEDQIVASIVEEDVAFGPENLRLPPSEIAERVDRALALTGLSEYRRNGSHSLSGGQKQRLALAGALALRPDLLLLDEATSMLDPEGRNAFLSCLAGLRRDGLAILQITHRMEEAVEADRVLVMERGAIVWEGASASFFQGAYEEWGFDEPPELRLYRELRARGRIAADTLPTVDDMLEALCRSS
jgi:ABC-type cobalt transport system, ATPase component